MTLTIRDIQTAVADEFGVAVYDLLGGRRTAELVKPRHIAMFLSRELMPGTSFPQIGKAFRDRDHTTIMHGARRGREILDTDPEARKAAASALARLEHLNKATQMNKFRWTPDALQTLSQQWSEGVPTATIAAVLGTTKNSVISKAHGKNLGRHGTQPTPVIAYDVERLYILELQRRAPEVPPPRMGGCKCGGTRQPGRDECAECIRLRVSV